MTTVDIVLLRQHILGYQPLSSEALAIADVNGDEVASTLDIAQMRRYILGNTSAADHTRVGQVIPEPQNPVIVTDRSDLLLSPGFVLPGDPVVSGVQTIHAANRPVRVQVAGIRLTGTLPPGDVSMISGWYVTKGAEEELAPIEIGRGVVDEMTGESSLFVGNLSPVIQPGESLTIFYAAVIRDSSKAFPVAHASTVGLGSLQADAERWEVVDAETGVLLPVSLGEPSEPVKLVMIAYPEVIADPIVPANIEYGDLPVVFRFKIRAIGGDVKILSYFLDKEMQGADLKVQGSFGYIDDHYGEPLRDPNLPILTELYLPFTIPQGATYSFELRARFGFNGAGWLGVSLNGSSAPPTEGEFPYFLWAPAEGGKAWNGFGVPGFPPEGLKQVFVW